MRKLAVLTFITLDGVMQVPSDPDEDRTNGFEQGGWACECWDDVMTQVMQEAMAEPYDLLLGKKTYDMFATNFSNIKNANPVASLLNKAKKYVATSSAEPLLWNNAERITSDIVSEVIQLKEEGPLLQIHGSWQLIQTLLAKELIDEFRLWTFPIIIGNGKHLFSQGTTPLNLKLVKTAACSSGAIMRIYHRA